MGCIHGVTKNRKRLKRLSTCEIDSQCEVAVWLRELVLSDGLEGWEGLGDGGFQERGSTCAPVADWC